MIDNDTMNQCRELEDEYGLHTNDSVGMLEHHEDGKTIMEWYIDAEHYLVPLVVGGGAIVCGYIVEGAGGVLTFVSAAAVPETFGLSLVGVVAGVTVIGGGHYLTQFGYSTINAYGENLTGGHHGENTTGLPIPDWQPEGGGH